MQSAEFVKAYHDELPERTVHAGVLPDAMAEAREWSHVFGQVLHHRLAEPDAPPEVNFEKLATEYSHWARKDLGRLNDWLWEQNTVDAHRALHELNFHNVNYAMMGAWYPLLYEGDSHRYNQAKRINLFGAQTCLALNSIVLYKYRHKNSTIASDYRYYAADNFEQRSTNEGSLNEDDAGIVSLQLAAKGIVRAIVPAPMQFENKARPAQNVDYVALAEDGQAVGLQVKARVTDEIVARYHDTERVVLIDGSVDFGNTAVRRITPGSSKLSRVSWGGTLSISRVTNIPTVGPDAKVLTAYGLPTSFIMRKKQQARALIGDAKPDFNRAVHILGERLSHHFEVGQSQSA